MAAPKPQITVKGSTVIWRQGGTTRRHPTGSHDQAIELAASLDEAWEAEQAARRANYESKLERGVDVIRYPDDTDPDPEPAVDEPDEPAVDEYEVEVTVDADWDSDDERVTLTIESTHDVQLWRSIGGRSSTFDVNAGDPLTRTFKAVAGDLMEIRFDDDQGDVVATHTFG